MDLKEALEAALEQQRRLLRDREQLDTRLADVDVEVRGLRMALERHLQGATREGLTLEGLRSFTRQVQPSLARTDAIERILLSAARPLSPNEIQEALHAQGRDDEYNAVSAAVAHLAKTGRAHSVGRGQWLAGADPLAKASGDNSIARRATRDDDRTSRVPRSGEPASEEGDAPKKSAKTDS